MENLRLSTFLFCIVPALFSVSAFAHPGHDGSGIDAGWSLAHFLLSPGHGLGFAILALCASVFAVRKYFNTRRR